MKLDGNVDDKALVTELSSENLASCVPLIRKTDNVVGSLNVELMIRKDSSVSPALQSPVNKEAETCLLGAMRKWKVKKAGAGRAMVLLTIAQ